MAKTKTKEKPVHEEEPATEGKPAAAEEGMQ